MNKRFARFSISTAAVLVLAAGLQQLRLPGWRAWPRDAAALRPVRVDDSFTKSLTDHLLHGPRRN